jgi:copper transport protein
VPRRFVLLALLFALAIVRPVPSAAHAGLRLSDPLEGVALGDSPTIIRLSFSEAPEPSLSSVQVLDPNGGAHQVGPARRAPADPLSLLVNVRPLERGVYIVRWRTVSAVDGHASAGTYAFGVRMPITGAPPPSALAAPTPKLELLARAVIIAGLMALLGAIGSALAGVGRDLSIGLAFVGSLAALLGVVFLAFAQRAAAGTTFAQLVKTPVGSALVWRAVAGGVAAMAAGLALAARATTARLIALSVAMMAGLSMILVHVAAGHAAASGSTVNRAAAVAVQAAHFASAGIWFGGLAALLIAVRGPASSSKAAAIRRFSTMAAIAFFLVAGTGLVRAVEAVTSWDELTTSTYGRILAAKAALFAAAAICAAANRWRSLPAAPRTLRPFRLTSGWELTLLGGATLAAATLTASPPPSAERQAFALTAAGHDFGTTVRARLAAASDQPGANRFVVRLSDYDAGTPVRADRVSLRFAALDDPGVEPTSLQLAAGPGNTYVGSGANMSFDGRWQVVVLVERAGGSVEIPLEIETQLAPRSVTVQRPTGQSASYMVEIWRAGLIRFRAEPERAGPARLQIECFDFIGDPRIVDSMIVTIASRAADGRTRQVPVQALARGRFVADVTLATGVNTIAAVAHTPDGTRIRAKTVINIPR